MATTTTNSQRQQGKEKALFMEILTDIIETMSKTSSITEQDYINSSNDSMKLWDMYKILQEKVQVMETNPYYKKHLSNREIRERNFLTDVEKLQKLHIYCVCGMCDRVIKKCELKKHQKTKICYDIRLTKQLREFETTRTNCNRFIVQYKLLNTHVYFHLIHVRSVGDKNKPDNYWLYNERERV